MKYTERLRELRIERGLSQKQLADATGLSQSAIARWELGQSQPNATALITLSKFYNESADYLLGITDD